MVVQDVQALVVKIVALVAMACAVLLVPDVLDVIQDVPIHVLLVDQIALHLVLDVLEAVLEAVLDVVHVQVLALLTALLTAAHHVQVNVSDLHLHQYIRT